MERRMAEKTTRVLVVDDSRVIREMISDFLRMEPDFQVAGTACSGEEALKKLPGLRPDVITLDVQMPGLDGLETLKRILEIEPIPVVMVSSVTHRDATATLDALELGAVDYIPKPDSLAAGRRGFREELTRKIRSVSGVDVRGILQIRRQRAARRRTTQAKPERNSQAERQLANKCIAIGISTGGPPALSSLFSELAPPMPPILVVQHMPGHFTGAFAKRLDGLSQLVIQEAKTGDTLRTNGVWIAPGGKQMEIHQRGREAVIRVRDGEPVSGHIPSVDVTMNAAAVVFKNRCLGVIMTGMGRDGVDGCRAIRETGGYVLGQDEATSDVYGMNKAAFVEGHVDRQFGLPKAASAISQEVRRRWLEQARPSLASRA